ncbi:MAG: N4-gp56 family major capsid protein [Gammaproteobacteria bacterium]|nr:N4-gp56 family major capsid protein [Gammaproteobacteria bacterium]
MVMESGAPVAQRTNKYAEAEMLAHAQPVQVLNMFGDSQPLPKNSSKIISLRRWDLKALVVDGSGNPVPLTEGVEPSGGDITYTDVDATLQQFGDFVEITDVCEDVYEDPVRQNATEHNGEQAGEIVELSCWGSVRGGTNTDYANGTARNQVNTPVSDVMIARIERSLMAAKAKHVRKVLTGDPDYETRPVKASYVIIGHTDLLYDFEQLTGWIPYQRYAGQDRICDYEEGSVGKFRVILSPTLTKWADAGGLENGMITTTGTNADVYPFIAFGTHAYGHTRLKGKNAITPMIVQPNSPSAGDRLGQVGSVGWKTYYVSMIQNQDWLVRGEVAATLL